MVRETDAAHGASELQLEQSRQQLHPIESRSLRDLVEIVCVAVIHGSQNWILRRGFAIRGFIPVESRLPTPGFRLRQCGR
jgi:hypothetical protein